MTERMSVVIPAFNEGKCIGATLASLYDCERPNLCTSFIVVDNGSTDNTDEVLRTFALDNPDFPLSIVEELQKGTGYASSTGFEYAIETDGADIVARTDGDTRVSVKWLKAIEESFQERSKTKLVTGPSNPLKDEWYRPIDQVAYPVSRAISRLLKELALPTIPSKRILTPGHNLATLASAYEAVGGFPGSSIDDTNEDIEYRNNIIAKFGVTALEFNRNMSVDTSMRRMRQVGYSGLFAYYVNRGDKEKRSKASDGVIDIR
jgi:glycosyltransferase involved in cell wall biosynthesis